MLSYSSKILNLQSYFITVSKALSKTKHWLKCESNKHRKDQLSWYTVRTADTVVWIPQQYHSRVSCAPNTILTLVSADALLIR